MEDFKRVIPCLDIRGGRLVKGVNFKDIKDIGDPVEAARFYEDAGADELVLLDIGASSSKEGINIDLISKIRGAIDIPFVVGGGIGSIGDIESLLNIGVDKISIGSTAIKNPRLIADGAKAFGPKRIVVSIDAKRESGSRWDVYIGGGTHNTGIDVISWARELQEFGAGEILLNSMDRDGTNDGYDIELIRAVKGAVHIPVIASGGAGGYEHFYEALVEAGADAVLAASLFHYRVIDISTLKNFLKEREISVY